MKEFTLEFRKGTTDEVIDLINYCVIGVTDNVLVYNTQKLLELKDKRINKLLEKINKLEMENYYTGLNDQGSEK